jgi:hypothetical protein
MDPPPLVKVLRFFMRRDDRFDTGSPSVVPHLRACFADTHISDRQRICAIKDMLQPGDRPVLQRFHCALGAMERRCNFAVEYAHKKSQRDHLLLFGR